MHIQLLAIEKVKVAPQNMEGCQRWKLRNDRVLEIEIRWRLGL